MSQFSFVVLTVTLTTLLTITMLYTPHESFSIRPFHDCGPKIPQWLCHDEHNYSKETPVVTYPTKDELFAYLNKTGDKTEFISLSNSSQGIASNIETATSGNTTWVAWEGNVNGTDKIFLRVSYNQSLLFTPAVELSDPKAGNASKLQIAASEDGNLVYATWQDSNIETGKNRIFVSASMDGGQEFKTYTLNLPGDADSIDPELTVYEDEVLISWIQNGPNGSCGKLNGSACLHGRW
ncbi:MAG: hypothetical protein H0U27_08405 [Nitrosopumilus sp.]|nr:hypothetical protein [Nitrosopumilus sp.]